MAPAAKRAKTAPAPKSTIAAFFGRKATPASEGSALPAASEAGAPAAAAPVAAAPLPAAPAAAAPVLVTAAPLPAAPAPAAAVLPAAPAAAAAVAGSDCKHAPAATKAPKEMDLSAAHKLIDLAKDAQWEDLFRGLEDQPHVVNLRPEVREYGILHQAAFHGCEVTVRKLLEKWAADPHLLTRSGETAAQVAKEQGHPEVAALFSAPVADSELTPEKVARAADMPESLAHKLIDLARDARWSELLLELKARPELVNVRPPVREYSVLLQAVYHGEQEIVNTLIDKFGADLHAESKFGEKALSVAKGQGHDALLKSLQTRLGEAPAEADEDDDDIEMVQMPDGSWKVKLGSGGPKAEPSPSEKGVVPVPALTPEVVKDAHQLLDLAKDGLWSDVFARLDSKRSLVNARPAVREFSLLHQAAWQGDAKALATLIDKYGADPEIRSKQGKSISSVAAEEGHAALIDSVLK